MNAFSPRAAALRPAGAAAWRFWSQHEWLVCAAIAALWFGATAWLRPLAIPDEGRYVGVAWEMLRSGDWAVPTQNGLPFFHKPPLFYWVTAAALRWFGPGVMAARAAPWLAAVLLTTVLFAFVRRHADARRAWATVAVLGTLPIFYGGAQYANMDMPVAACISVAILLFADTALARDAGRTHRGTLALAFAAAAFGVLAKGLIGAVLPALVLLAWGLATRRARNVLALLGWAPGWLLFLGITLPWFIAMQRRFPDFGHYFFVVQHFQRFASGGFNNPQPVWFYPALLALTTLPWSPWLVAVARRGWRAHDADADLRLLMLAWAAVVTVFFSLPASKLAGYILPAVPPLACLIADAAQASAWRTRVAALAAAVCIASVVAAHYLQPKSMRALAEHLQAARQPAEPVLLIGQYPYDLAFYARLDAPVGVVDPWSPADLAHDGWRRELADAARFAPAGGRRQLLRPDGLTPALCGAPVSWVVAPSAMAGELPAAQAPVYRADGSALWRIDASAPAVRRALHCDEPVPPPH